MVAGLPGTGIGGLFYLLLVMLMPLRHGWRALRRRARAGHGRLVLRSLALGAAVVAVLWAQAWALKWTVLALAPLLGGVGPTSVVAQFAGATTTAYMKAAAFASLGSLAAVVIAVHVARLVVKRPTLPASAAAPLLPLRRLARRAG